MNKGLINLWYENQNLIDVIAEDFSFKSYSDLLFVFLDKVVKLKNCENKETESKSEHFCVTGIYEDKELGKEYKIEVSGYLEYGTCEVCDLTRFLSDYGRTERKKVIKLVLLNIIQKAYVDVDYPESPDMEDFTREEFIEQDLCDKVWDKWKDLSYPSSYEKWNNLLHPNLHKKDEIFVLFNFLITYFYELDENPEEKTKLLCKKLIFKEDLTKEEKEKLNLAYASSVREYPMYELIKEIANLKFAQSEEIPTLKTNTELKPEEKSNGEQIKKPKKHSFFKRKK